MNTRSPLEKFANTSFSKLGATSKKISLVKHWPFIFMAISFLSVLQNYIYSELKNTGFYLSESILYNLIWIFFIPLGYMVISIHQERKVTYWNQGFIAIVTSILHILLFTGFFYTLSFLIFDPHHRFQVLLKSATANYFLLMLFIYFILPQIHRNRESLENVQPSTRTFKIKEKDKITYVDAQEILFIKSERPYVALHSKHGKKLISRSIKQLALELETYDFIQVHRSLIINKKFVTSLSSRKNGDYDAIMEDGGIVRLSRHYRENWESLL